MLIDTFLQRSSLVGTQLIAYICRQSYLFFQLCFTVRAALLLGALISPCIIYL